MTVEGFLFPNSRLSEDLFEYVHIVQRLLFIFQFWKVGLLFGSWRNESKSKYDCTIFVQVKSIT